MLNSVFANRLRPALSGSALVLLLAALAPALATAAPRNPEEPPTFSVGMQVKGSHGYKVAVSASDHRNVDITVSKGQSFTTYSVPGRATSERIEANFGKFGRVSLRFAPSEKPATGRKRACHSIKGHFDGVIRFHGELDYTEVTAKRARGSVDPPGGRSCDPGPLPRPGATTRPSLRDFLAKAAEPDLGFTAVGAAAHLGGRTIIFYDVELNEIAPNAKIIPFLTITLGATEERRGRISISRRAFLLLERSVAIPSPPGVQPLSATVRGPKPFQGTGSYLAAPGAEPTWTGDLSVPLPGAGLVPLTGPEFDALLCTGGLTKANEACLDEVEDIVGMAEPPAPGQSGRTVK